MRSFDAVAALHQDASLQVTYALVVVLAERVAENAALYCRLSEHRNHTAFYCHSV